MSNRGGRPTSLDMQRRKARFLTLIAEGRDATTSAKASGLNPWQALEVVTESSFNEIVQAIRASEITVAVVRTADAGDDHQVAA